MATQQDIAITFAFEAKELANNIAADSFLFTLNSIPQLGNDILSLLSLNTIVHEQLTNFQVAGELSSEQRDALSAAILKSDHTRFYQSLMWLAEKSSYMSDNKLLTANFQSSNLSSTNLIHLRQIAHSVEQHQTFVALQDQTTLSLDDISLHLLTADTIRFLTENNPLFPPRYFVGKGLSKA
ncbi:MAG: hypothetical protein H6765_06525 [Candidatus Peribacteria bacterium]|nr:MAG: hypothetical protein H6765_06525 [Candidatus Peribacteria bacterium]